MKTLHLIILLCLTLSVSANTVCKFDPEAHKIEQRQYVIKKAKLTEQEAKLFFDLFDVMRDKERVYFSKNHSKERTCPKTEEECKKAILERDNDELQMKKIQHQYHIKMLKVLPASKVFQALKAAEKFDRQKIRESIRKTGDKK